MTTLILRPLAAAGFVAVTCLSISCSSFVAGEQSAPMFPKEGPSVPLGLPEIFWPKDNPYTPDKAELGWLLYFDKRLSIDNTVACANCHDPRHGFTDGRAFSKGIREQLGGRSAPTVINRAYSLD